MKKLLAFIFVIFLSPLIAQEYLKDSLFQEYENSTGKERVDKILLLSQASNTPLSVMNKLSKEALSIATQFDNEVKQKALYIRANYYSDIQESDSAYYYYSKLVSYPIRKNNFLLFVKSWNILSFFHGLKHEYDTSTQLIEKIRKASVRFHNEEAKAYYYESLGRIELVRNLHIESIEHFKKALKYFKAVNNYEQMGYCYILLTDAYATIQHQKDAAQYISLVTEIEPQLSIKLKAAMYFLMARLFFLKEYQTYNEKELLLRALKQANYLENEFLTARIYSSLAIYYARNQMLDSALYYNRISLNSLTRVGDMESLLTVYQNTITMYSDNNQLEMAMKYVDSASAIIHKAKTISHLANLFLQMGGLYLEKGEYKKSQSYIDSLYTIMDKIPPITKKRIYEFEVRFYKKTNNLTKALASQDKYIKLNDSIMQAKHNKMIEDTYIKYKTRKKEQEIFFLKQENEKKETQKQRIIFIWIVTIILLLALGIVFILFRKNAIQRRALTQENTLRLEKENQLKEQEKVRLTQENQIKESKNKSLLQEKKLLESQKEVALQKVRAHKNMLTVTNNSLMQQSQLAANLQTSLKSLRPYCNTEGKNKISSYIADLSGITKERNWQVFEQNFTTIYPYFLSTLIERYPNLTSAEIKICAFLKIGKKTQEISQITMQSRHSIYGIKKRLREKLNLKDNEELTEFIQSLS